METHFKCRNAIYPGSNEVKRAFVPDDRVSWNIEWTDYEPLPFTFPNLPHESWADPDITEPHFTPDWNEVDDGVDRTSFTGMYKIVNSAPQNPVGRTGLIGRGSLGRWGPNHAADPIVTKWKRDNKGRVLTDSESGKKILQAILIQRRDCGEWAIPGGMVDPGEKVSQTLKREFMEEALDSLSITSEEKARLEERLDYFFSQGDVIYGGYVDDPRNTDNAWMETVAMNFHDDNSNFIDSFPLKPGDDAVGVQWKDVSQHFPLYASHTSLLESVARKFDAFW